MSTPDCSIDLVWLPLGAGGHSVRWNGWVYEAACARLEHRSARALYHSALVVSLPSGRWTVEMTPAWAGPAGQDRGVVAEGAVGTGAAGRYRLVRYEVRRWQDGLIGDLDAAVGGPVRLSDDPAVCQRLLDLLTQVPRPVWGRDGLRTGEMWSCNSVTSWALTCSGLDASAVRPPGRGRAPGWRAGVVAAGRTTRRSPPVSAWPFAKAADHVSASLPGPVGLRP